MEDTVLPFLISNNIKIFIAIINQLFLHKKKGTRVPPLRISDFLGEGSLILVYYIVFI